MAWRVAAPESVWWEEMEQEMSPALPADVVRRFVSRINVGDVDGIAELMTEDHRFIDSLGVEVVGRAEMRRGWKEYFRLVPDYRIEVRDTFTRGDVVVLLGFARGTCEKDDPPVEEAWETPAAWRVRVREGYIAEWQVYADNEPIRRTIRET